MRVIGRDIRCDIFCHRSVILSGLFHDAKMDTLSVFRAPVLHGRARIETYMKLFRIMGSTTSARLTWTGNCLLAGNAPRVTGPFDDIYDPLADKGGDRR